MHFNTARCGRPIVLFIKHLVIALQARGLNEAISKRERDTIVSEKEIFAAKWPIKPAIRDTEVVKNRL